MELNMNLLHLRYFAKLAQTLHYTRAAEHLCIAQPSLSHAISQMEAELGVPLLRRWEKALCLPIMGNNFWPVHSRLLWHWTMEWTPFSVWDEEKDWFVWGFSVPWEKTLFPGLQNDFWSSILRKYPFYIQYRHHRTAAWRALRKAFWPCFRLSGAVSHHWPCPDHSLSTGLFCQRLRSSFCSWRPVAPDRPGAPDCLRDGGGQRNCRTCGPWIWDCSGSLHGNASPITLIVIIFSSILIRMLNLWLPIRNLRCGRGHLRWGSGFRWWQGRLQ